MHNSTYSSRFYLGAVNTLSAQTVASKIESFAALPVGWDYGTGGPIAFPVINSALEWNDFLVQQGPSYTDAFPGSDGEIVLAAGFGDDYIEVIVESDGRTVSVAHDFQRKQMLYRSYESQEEAKQLVRNIVGQRWNASTSFIQENTM
jgi:hypothetical protein